MFSLILTLLHFNLWKLTFSLCCRSDKLDEVETKYKNKHDDDEQESARMLHDIWD